MELTFTEEELKALRQKLILFDEDDPETTVERALKFHRVNPVRKTELDRA